MSASDWLKTNYSGSSSSSETTTPSKDTSSSSEVSSINSGKYYRIKNVNSGKYLSVPNNNSGAKVVQTSSTGNNTIWQVNGDVNSGYVKLACQVGDGLKVLDIPGGSKNNSTVLQIWGNGNSTNQDFKIKNLGSGKFAILTRVSNDARCLDVNSHSKDEGASIIQYDYKGGNNQQWIFEIVR